MHPAFSVLVFTTLSGAGYGLWFWLAVVLLLGGGEAAPRHLLGFALGTVLVSAGLLASLAHLGQPQRAWRALGQWRTSWLSREGVLALLTYLPLAVVFGAWFSQAHAVGRWALLALALGSLATVVCTAMIYASLKPIPAWRHPLVLPGYLGFALYTGGALTAVLLAYDAGAHFPTVALGLAAAATALAALKWRYWRDVDLVALPSTAAAVGMAADRTVRSWEAPHTEANYLTREMGFVLARRHAQRLRAIALLAFAALPAVLFALSATLEASATSSLLTLSALSALLGTLVERWLFFAQARHVVGVYYG